MEEGQDKKFLGSTPTSAGQNTGTSKSSIENSQFMTNVIEKKPNIFKRIFSKFSQPAGKAAKPKKEKFVEMPTVPDVAPKVEEPALPTVPEAAPTSETPPAPTLPPEPAAEAAPKESAAPTTENSTEHKNPLDPVLNKIKSVDFKDGKTLAIIAGILVVIIIIILLIIFLPKVITKLNDPDHTTPTDYSGYTDKELLDEATKYQNSSEEERNKHQYDELGTTLEQNYQQNIREHDPDSAEVIFATMALARYQLSNGYEEEGLELLEEALADATNNNVRFHYLNTLYVYYKSKGDTAKQIYYLEQLIALPEDEIFPLDPIEFPALAQLFREELAELKGGNR